MKIKSALKYQVYESRKPIVIFYIVMILFYVLIAISSNISYSYGSRVNSSGLETATIIFLFIVGLNSFKSTFYMMTANGVSRRTMFFSFVAAAVAICAGMAVIDSLLGVILRQFAYYKSIVEIQFDYFLEDSIGIGLIWMFANYLCAIMVGYFITTLYYRMNRAVKLLVSIGVPVFFLIVFPIIDSHLFGGVIYTGVTRFFSYVSGLDYKDPIINIGWNIIVSAIWASLAYINLRRAPVKA